MQIPLNTCGCDLPCAELAIKWRISKPSKLWSLGNRQKQTQSHSRKLRSTREEPSIAKCRLPMAWWCWKDLKTSAEEVKSLRRQWLLQRCQVDFGGKRYNETLRNENRHHWSEDNSVQFSHSVMSDSLWPHGWQHARPPCPSPTPRVYSDSCPLSQWCYPTISSSVVPFSSLFNLSHHQRLFQWVSSLHQVAKVLEFQHQSFQWIFRTDFL